MRCALKVQQRVPVLDSDQPPDQSIRFCIGIDIGYVIADGTDSRPSARREVSAFLVQFGIMCTDASTWHSRRWARFI